MRQRRCVEAVIILNPFLEKFEFVTLQKIKSTSISIFKVKSSFYLNSRVGFQFSSDFKELLLRGSRFNLDFEVSTLLQTTLLWIYVDFRRIFHRNSIQPRAFSQSRSDSFHQCFVYSWVFLWVRGSSEQICPWIEYDHTCPCVLWPNLSLNRKISSFC